VPGIRRSPSGRRLTESPSALPGSRTRDPKNEEGRTGGRAVLENVPPPLGACVGTFSRGAPSGSSRRISVYQSRGRPSRRPEVAENLRRRRTPHATAGRRAGTEARRAPNVTGSRCIGEPGPAAATAAGSASADRAGPVTATDSGHGNRSRCRSRTTPTRRTTTRCVENAHGRCWRTRFFGTRVAEPVIAEEVATGRRPQRNRRNDWLRAMGPECHPSPVRPFSCAAGPKNHGLR
jgi:hypothetical protein